MVLEDDPYLRRLMEKVFRNGGLEIHPAGTIMAAKELLTSNRFDALIADIHVPDGKGTDLVREFRDKLSGDGTVVVMVTGEARYRYLEEELGIDLYLEKPVAVQDLVALVNRLTSAAAKAGFQ
jgi:DNA-binding response OmpR family regulator